MEFSSQAPEGNWNEPWYNDCEEVSIVMVDSYYVGRKLTPAVAKNEILRMFEIKEKAFGPSLEEDSDQNVSFINNYLNSNWEARIAENPAIEEIKAEIDKRHPVIMPVDGRMLDNRYYTTTHYHVFVISGYDDDKGVFITQDGGTYRGHDYEYSYDIIMDAMHDYNPTDMSLGRRVAIFTSLKTEKKDAEKTNEPKIEESLTPAPTAIASDTPDSEKIKNDNSPIAPEKNIDAGILETIKNYFIRFIDWVKKIFAF